MPKKVLVIDDEEDMVELVRLRLEAKGYEVIGSFDGEDGLEKAKNIKPDLILLDIMMPKIDGYNFVSRIKEDVSTRAIPVIVLTAHQRMVKVLQIEGVKDYIIKPFEAAELIAKVRKHIGDALAKKVLLIDDEPAITELLGMRLRASDFDVVIASNGREGLDKVKSENPDLIVLDVLMPVMDGFEFYKTIKKDPLYANIPVIVLTARSMMRDIFAASDVDEFVSKPFDGKEMVDKIRYLLKDKALVLSDDTVSDRITDALRSYRYEVHLARDEEAVFEHAKASKYKIVVVYLTGVKSNPADFIAKIRTIKNKDVLIIMYCNWRVQGAERDNIAVLREMKNRWQKAGANDFYDMRLVEADFPVFLSNFIGEGSPKWLT